MVGSTHPGGDEVERPSEDAEVKSQGKHEPWVIPARMTWEQLNKRNVLFPHQQR